MAALLTARERQVLDQLVRGSENAEIARNLGIAPRTVGKHLERIYEKLNVRNRGAAVAIASNARS